MGHDHHFLSRLDRVSGSQCELALHLYRDDDLVRRILFAANIEGTSDRIAIALAAGDGAPHIIVAGNGHFVTCLGEGMSTARAPVISYAQLDAIADDVRDLRERLDAKKNYEAGDGKSNIVNRMLLAGDRLSREEYYILFGVKDLFARDFRDWVVEDWGRLDELVPDLVKLRWRRDRPDLETSFWKMVWGAAHVLPLTAASTAESIKGYYRVIPPAYYDRLDCAVTGLGTSIIGLRALWVACTHTEVAFHRNAKRYRRCSGVEDLVTSILTLVGIAARAPRLHDEVAAILAKSPGVGGNWPEFHESFRDAIDAALSAEPARMPAMQPARAMLKRMVTARVRAALNLDVDGPEAETLLLPAFMHASFRMPTTAEELCQLIRIVPFVVRAKPEELYFPEAFLQAAQVRYDRQKYATMVVHMDHDAAPRGNQGKSRPGPNDPCACGSGKKVKKCCGSPSRVKSP